MEPALPIAEVTVDQWAVRPTGVAELDRVLAGGLVPGSVTLLGGEPGIGKSTLLLQAASSLAASGARVLYVSAEESRPQVRLRAKRLGALEANVWLASEPALPAVVAQVAEVDPDVLVIDSVQTMHDPAIASAPGSVSQVRDCAHQLVQLAKQRSMATVLVGHVTKDGGLAGPRVLEHVVDTVLSFEGERHHALRLLRALKHRFGATGQLGLFEMGDAGLLSVSDPGQLFLGDRCSGVPGSVVVPTVDGQRALLVEVQALLVESNIPTPRRSAQGVDAGRLNLLLAVLERRLGLKASSHEVYALAVGGVRVAEPGADLGLALAVASALGDWAVADDMVVVGEVGLAGELRQVSQTPRRLTEAARLGFRRALVPASVTAAVRGIELTPVSSLREAVAVARTMTSKSGAAEHPPRPPPAGT